MILVSLNIALYILAVLGKSFTDIQKRPPSLLGSISYLFPVSSLGRSVEVPAIRVIFYSASIKELSHFSSEELQLYSPPQRFPALSNRS